MAEAPLKKQRANGVATLPGTLNIEMDESRFLGMMERVIPLAKLVQNNPAEGLVPKEGVIVDEVTRVLKPYTVENGGPLKVEIHSFQEGRSNMIITCPGKKTENKTYVTFCGSHLDVVPVDLELWDSDPFKLGRDGDLLTGRGTTDCLGHVCLITDFLCTLAQKQAANGGEPVTDSTVVAVFIASEENGSGGNKGVGIDGLAKRGLLEHLKDGVLLWVDCADSNPCMATAGALQWTLKVEGRKAHSGLPHIGINSIELGLQATKYLQDRFYKDFPAKPEAATYKFPIASSMKPTQFKCAPGAINQIPSWVEVKGDIRLTPFYDCFECMAKVESYVKDLNDRDLTNLPCHGPYSKYVLGDEKTEKGQRGKLTLTFLDRQDPMRGVYCNLKSNGFKALSSSVMAIKGKCAPESLTGSLPLVQDMKEAGFDLQMIGFGLSSCYHRPNEACKLSDMADATKILSLFLSKLDKVL